MANMKPLVVALSIALAWSGSTVAQTVKEGSGVSSAHPASRLDAQLEQLAKQTRQARLRRAAGAVASTNTAPGPAPAVTGLSATVPAATTDVTVNIVATGDISAVRKQLEGVGLNTKAVFHDNIDGQLPITALDDAASVPGVLIIRKAEARTNSGSVQSQGDVVMGANRLRNPPPADPGHGMNVSQPVDGSGITIGVLSDSFNCLASYNAKGRPHLDTQQDDVASGDLPGGVYVAQEGPCAQGGTDEGRAMAQLIHDVAPGARVAFYAPVSPADMAQGIELLAMPTDRSDALGRHGAGAQIIVDDLTYPNAEPIFQTGIIGDAVDEVTRRYGVRYFSSAGNQANNGAGAYDNTSATFATRPVANTSRGPRPANLGEKLLNFDASGATTVENLPITIPGAQGGKPYDAWIVLYWDQPVTGKMASSSLDMCLANADGTATGLCSGPSGIGSPAMSNLRITNSGGTTKALLRVGLAGGKAPRRVHIVVADGFTSIDKFGTAKGTIVGHHLATSGVTLGAADYLKTPRCNPSLPHPELEAYSSVGGLPLLFGPDGTALASPQVPLKPEFVGPDGATTTFFESSSFDTPAEVAAGNRIAGCASVPGHEDDQFYGTSAAAPHVAAFSALVLGYDSSLTTADLKAILRQNAQSMADPNSPYDADGFDFSTGYGFVHGSENIALQVYLRNYEKRNGSLEATHPYNLRITPVTQHWSTDYPIHQ